VNQVLKLLGLGQRARIVVSGDEGVRAKLERRQARLVIIAADAAPATQHDFSTLSRRFRVPFVIFGMKAELGAALGKSPRAVLTVLDQHLARRILECIEEPHRQARE